jgi:hypothetical protein
LCNANLYDNYPYEIVNCDAHDDACFVCHKSIKANEHWQAQPCKNKKKKNNKKKIKKPQAATPGSEEQADGQTQPSTTALPEDPPLATPDTSAEEQKRERERQS